MSDDPRPKKRSRFFDQLKWFPRSSSSKATDRPKTPPQRSKAPVPGLQGHVPPPLHNPRLRPRLNQQHATYTNRLAAPTRLEESLFSPRTATAAAFQNLSVEDHASKEIPGPQTLVNQARAVAADDAPGNASQATCQDVHDSIAASLHALNAKKSNSAQDHRVAIRGAGSFPSPGSVNIPKTGFQHRLGAEIIGSQVIPLKSSQSLAPCPTRSRPVRKQDVNQPNVVDRRALPPPPTTPTCTPNDVHPQGENAPNAAETSFPQPTTNLRPGPCDSEAPPFYTKSTNHYGHSLTNPTSLETRKRKRASTTLLPPPAHIYTRTNDPNFNIFSAILLYPELCYHLALHLPLVDLISLYAISRDYHTILDTRFTTLIISLAEHLTPNAVKVFPFRCYAHLCRPDPAARIPHPDPLMAQQGVVRKIPSFRWLKMLIHREKVVHEIMALAAERGVPFPRRCKEVLLKFWFILDIPDNARRVGYIHNERLFGELDLYFGMCVVVRLDMLFNDPVGTEKRDGGRRMVLAQRSLTSLVLVLKGEIWKTKVEVLREWVRWKFDPRDEDVRDLGENRGEGIFGVPLEECGSLKKQWWGEKRKLEGMNKRMNENGEQGDVLWLLRPDQLIVREVVRRGLRFRKHVLRCMLYGYVDPRTLGDLDWETEGRSTARRKQGLESHNEYNFDDLVGGARCVDMADGDRLLDLGKKPVGSRRCTREGVSEQERKWREGEMDFARKSYAWWQLEVADAGVGEEEMSGWESE